MKSTISPFVRRVLTAVTLLSFTLSCPAAQWKAWYGNLHSHSSVSDGVDTPADAYAWAKSHGVNFLCLSEHNHMSTAAELLSVSNAAHAATSPTFVALVGQEFSKLDPGGNHVNIHDVSNPIPTTLDNNYRMVFRQWLPDYVNTHPQAIVVCQFNHPDRPEHDYGIAAIGSIQNYAGDRATFVSEVDPWVSLIAIISGPADSNISKTTVPQMDIHQDTKPDYITCWKKYLDYGFHLSPVADQDNHRASWGTRTTARTGVWIDGPFNRQSLLMALRAGRTFATEDQNLSVWFEIDGQPMGSILPDPGDKSFTITVRVDDDNEPNSRYNIEVYRDIIGDGPLAAPLPGSGIGIPRGQTWTRSVTHTAGTHELFMVRVYQKSSSPVDDAWTAPIWIDPAFSPEAPIHLVDLGMPADAQWIGAKGRSVYHFPDCKTVLQIAAPNRVFFTAPPGNRHLHTNCPL